MAFGVDPTTPYMFTGGDIEANFFSQLLGGGPTATMLVQQALPYINNFLGLTTNPTARSAFMDLPLMSNMTPYGIYREQLNNQISRVASDALLRQSYAAKRQWIENINRTTMSFASWQQTKNGKLYAGMSPAEQELAYNNYITTKTLGDSDNFLYTLGYNLLDPDGLVAASTYLQQAGANQVRFGSQRGSRTAMLQARAIGNMFTDETTGKFTFKRSDYGFMSIGDAAAIAAALTKERDFFDSAGSGPITADKMKQAVTDLQTAVQSYTKALGPLKDVFGSDIPAMIRSIEDLSGKRMTTLQPDQISTLVSRVMANTIVGGYNIGQLVNARTQMTSAIRQMNVPFYNELGAASQAMTSLNMTATGMTPAMMTDARYQRNVADWVLRTSNSAGAGYINAAAAIWLDRNTGKTLDQFEEAYRTMRGQYGATDALMRMTGTANLYMLNVAGMQSGNYQRVIEADAGGRLSRWESLEALIDKGRNMSNDRTAFDEAIALAKTQSKLLSSSKAIDDAIKNKTVSERVAKQLRFIQAGMGMGITGEQLATGLTAYAEDEQKRKDAALAEQRLAAAQALKDVWIPENVLDVANEFIKGTPLEEIFEAGTRIAVSDPEMRRYLTSVGSAAKDMLYSNPLYKYMSEEQRKDYVSKNLTYGYLNGITNKEYQNALTRYEQATSENDKSRFALQMQIASNVDTQRLEDFLKENKEGWGLDINDGIYATWREAMLQSNGDTEVAGAEVEDYINYINIRNLMKSQGIDTESGLGLEFLEKLNTARRGTMKLVGEGDAYTGVEIENAYLPIEETLKLIDETFKPGSALADKMHSIARQGYGKDTSQEGKIEELVGEITKLMKNISTLTNKLDSVITEKGLKADVSFGGVHF